MTRSLPVRIGRFFLRRMLELGLCLASAVAAGTLPCYVLPLLGASERDWCGYKSAPPHFAVQFWTGFALAAAAICLHRWLARKRIDAA